MIKKDINLKPVVAGLLLGILMGRTWTIPSWLPLWVRLFPTWAALTNSSGLRLPTW